MIEAHPDETDLVQLAFADATVKNEVPRHVETCAECRAVVDTIRTQANALRLTAVSAGDATPKCLDDETIAAFAAGNVDPADSQSAITHLLDCPRCSQEVAAVARLLGASAVSNEIEWLRDRPKRGHRRLYFVRSLMVTGVLAAGVLILLVPGASQLAKRIYREESVTGAAAPRLLSPLRTAAPTDSFRWTSVPRADRYRITVFGRDGSVVWEAQTRDTAIALPDVLGRASDDTVLWRVQAHVGWEDRWASSELTMLTLRRAQR